MASIAPRTATMGRRDKLPYASPHGMLYALAMSTAFWLAILAVVLVAR